MGGAEVGLLSVGKRVGGFWRRGKEAGRVGRKAL
jgi:hypothetical protein